MVEVIYFLEGGDIMGMIYKMLFGGAQKPVNRDPNKVVAMPKPVIKAFDWLAERPMYEPCVHFVVWKLYSLRWMVNHSRMR